MVEPLLQIQLCDRASGENHVLLIVMSHAQSLIHPKMCTTNRLILQAAGN